MKKIINGYRVELLVHKDDALVRPRLYLCREFEVDGTVVTLHKAKSETYDSEWTRHEKVVLVNVPVRIVAHSWEVNVKGTKE